MSHEYFFKKLEEEGSLRNEIASLGWGFWPSECTAGSGYFDEHLLRILADEIERRNKPFWDEYEEYCRKNKDIDFSEEFDVGTSAL